MASKKQALSRQPSKEEQEREESSDEEENSESESGETEEEGSSDEEEETPVSTKPYKPQTLVKKSESKSKSTSLVNGSDSDAESEGSPPPDYKVQPIRKPSPSPAKRTHQEREESRDVSRGSKKLKTGEKEEKKSSASIPGGLIGRLWSDEDEIAVLNGMIDFRKVKGNDNNFEEIYNFIKGKLQGDFNKEQLRTKISRMKKRFLNALKKSSDPVFSKPHDDMAFELSKKIWGDVAANGSVAVKNAKKEAVKAEVEEMEKNDAEERDFWSKYPYLSSSFLNMRADLPSLSISEVSMDLLKENVSLIGDSKAKELNQKWRQLFLEEAEVKHKMLTLMAEQTKLGLNQMSDS